MAIRHYSSLDAGAPGLTGTRLIDRMRDILMACLVSGFGGKPGAGWTVGHSHADGFSLGNGDGFINLVHQSNTVYTAYIMESITGGSAALAAGVNRRSGPWYEGSGVAPRQYISCGAFTSGTNPHWVVVADDKSCNLMLGSSTDTADVAASQGVAHIFGKYLNAAGLGGFCSLGGALNIAGGALISFTGALLRHPFSGVINQGVDPVYACLGAAYQAGIVRARTPLQPDKAFPIRAGLLGHGAGVSGGAVVTAAVYCGRLRGVVTDPVLGGALASQVLPLLGASNTWQARVTPITLPGGKSWVPLFPSVNDQGFFVSLDPTDWE